MFSIGVLNSIKLLRMGKKKTDMFFTIFFLAIIRRTALFLLQLPRKLNLLYCHWNIHTRFDVIKIIRITLIIT